MKTTLKTLEMKGLRSFVEPTSITFPENGLVLLMGPSGSGKSSIFMGISHALGFCPYSATDLQSWLGDQKLEVKLGLSTSAGDSVITRGTKSFVEGVGAVQGAANVTPTITKLTGLNSDLLSALTYRPQGTAGLFLSKTNAEMQEFLSTLLGLDKFDTAVEKTEESIGVKKLNLDLAEAAVTSKKAEVERLADKQEYPIRDVEEFFSVARELELDCANVKTAIKLATQDLYNLGDAWMDKQEEFTKRKNEEQSKHPRPEEITTNETLDRLVSLRAQAYERIDRLQKEDKVRISGLKTKIRELQEELKEHDSYIRREHEWEQEMATKDAELAVLKASKCPRCKQKWTTEAVDKDIKATEFRIGELFHLLHACKQARNAATEVEREIHNHQAYLEPNPKIQQMTDVFNESTKDIIEERGKLTLLNTQRINEWQKQIQQAIYGIKEEEAQAFRVASAQKDAQNKVLNALTTELAQRTATWKDAVNRANTVERENEYARKENERLAAEWAAAKEGLERANNSLANAQKALREEQDLLELLKAFLTAIYDEVLDEIAYSTNQMLAEIPNVAHVTIKFKSERTTQKGTTRRAIVPVVNIGGGERPLRSALSGGMMTAVELAVDLAVRRVISARSGAVPGWLILDECFEGLPIAEKEACLELLKRAAVDTLILVIDHSSETKELFSSVITVENSNGRSSIAS